MLCMLDVQLSESSQQMADIRRQPRGKGSDAEADAGGSRAHHAAARAHRGRDARSGGRHVVLEVNDEVVAEIDFNTLPEVTVCSSSD
jgi:hypothetical protein